jgi:hypothetical protein
MGGGGYNYIIINQLIQKNMKTKIKLRLATIVTALLFSFTSHSQQILCDNYLNCDVTIFYEMYEWDASLTTCNAVCSGVLTIPAGGSGYVLPDCTPTGNPCDACIIITDIGGWTPPSNHSSSNVGHVMTPYGQSGSTGSGSCAPGTPWVATQTSGSWIIQ